MCVGKLGPTAWLCWLCCLHSASPAFAALVLLCSPTGRLVVAVTVSRPLRVGGLVPSAIV